MVHVVLNSDGNYDICVDDTVVGEVTVMSETDIAYVEVDEEHRGNGYGSYAIGEVVESIRDEHGMVRLSTPVNDSLRWVIREYGFREKYIMGDKLYVLYT